MGFARKDNGTWTSYQRCTGKGNGGKGCNRKSRITPERFFHTNAPGILSFTCMFCGKSTDVPAKKVKEK